jgi:uncharacterized membrane protein YecN with MAPEG domain
LGKKEIRGKKATSARVLKMNQAKQLLYYFCGILLGFGQLVAAAGG